MGTAESNQATLVTRWSKGFYDAKNERLGMIREPDIGLSHSELLLLQKIRFHRSIMMSAMTRLSQWKSFQTACWIAAPFRKFVCFTLRTLSAIQVGEKIQAERL
jgi:hypothetical protein